ncbi:hypothetical protein HAX54_033950 [Datura stramonium]|uniref:Uncharacterized protein n=1 Tax=Datura stramonium TaxID=4076 RepID=A0ABS8SDZ7_DATST|nr:hypothetical protein [Datura stramonium]
MSSNLSFAFNVDITAVNIENAGAGIATPIVGSTVEGVSVLGGSRVDERVSELGGVKRDIPGTDKGSL